MVHRQRHGGQGRRGAARLAHPPATEEVVDDVEVHHRVGGGDLHGQELDLLLQGLDVVYDLVEHAGLAGDLVAPGHQLLQVPHPLADPLPPHPLGEAVAVRGLPAPGSDVDVVGLLAGGRRLRLLPGARLGLLRPPLRRPSGLVRIAQLLLPSRPLAAVLCVQIRVGFSLRGAAAAAGAAAAGEGVAGAVAGARRR